MFTFVDLFAGSGGLTLGLRRAGGEHVLAVEKSPMAAETYFRNLIKPHATDEDWAAHRAASLKDQAAAGLFVGPMLDVLQDAGVMSELAGRDLDVVAGGPPCQGFSLAGRRNPQDPRNGLAWQFLQFVQYVQPKIVLIENVVGIDRKFRAGSARSPFESLKMALLGLGYVVQGVKLDALHYGAPQSRPRMMILGARRDVARSLGIQFSDKLLYSGDRISSHEGLLLPPTVKAHDHLTLASAIGDLCETSPQASDGDLLYQQEMRDGDRWGLLDSATWPPPNSEYRRHHERTKELFRLLQILTENSALAEARKCVTEPTDETRAVLNAKLAASRFPLVSPDGEMKLSSADAVVRIVAELVTRKHSQTALRWSKPARTVVTIPDDYIHPTEPRTFSVRELARMQGFPDAFQFYGKVTTGGTSRRVEVPQYSQVGNAVSPFVAYALGRRFMELMDEWRLVTVLPESA